MRRSSAVWTRATCETRLSSCTILMLVEVVMIAVVIYVAIRFLGKGDSLPHLKVNNGTHVFPSTEISPWSVKLIPSGATALVPLFLYR